MDSSQKSIYIETTVPSIITSRPSRDIRNLYRQEISKEFWEYERQKYNLYISQYVVEECKRGDEDAAKRRLELIKDIPSLPTGEDVENLAEEYYKCLGISKKAKTDCFHLAISVIGKMDYLMSWNMTHLGERYFNEVAEYNYKNNLWLPRMHTPDAIMDIEKEETKNEQ
jgi:hypothetical protein